MKENDIVWKTKATWLPVLVAVVLVPLLSTRGQMESPSMSCCSVLVVTPASSSRVGAMSMVRTGFLITCPAVMFGPRSQNGI